MIKLIIFDLDGVLVSTKDIHYRALNEALADVGEQYVIGRDEHVKQFDGKPSRVKLDMLTRFRGLPTSEHDRVYSKKQAITAQMLKEEIGYSQELVMLFKSLRREYQIHVASNSIRETIDIVLDRLGIGKLVDFVVSNEDVQKPKPAAEMYLRCMLRAGVGPRETMIVEDSYVGRQGVFASGANLCAVNSPEDLTIERIQKALYEGGSVKRVWKDERLNVLIPVAGRGSRFEKAGYTFPKPLIGVDGKPMIQVVVENLAIDAHYIFVVLDEHVDKYNIESTLKLIAPGCDVVVQKGYTEGAACSTLLAKGLIDNDSQLVIANSDQWVDWDSSAFMYAMQGDNVDGGILTFQNMHPKWSYAKLDEFDWVTEVAEKNPISTDATVGIYYWKRGSDYVRYAEQMVSKGIKTNNEFYVCPVFNEAIADGKHIKAWEVSEMRGMGTPEDLDAFLKGEK